MHEAACPVIVLIHAPDPHFVKEASKRGVFAYITDAEAKDWQSSIDIVLRRFAEYHELQGAFVEGPSRSAPRASSWNATPSTRVSPSRCCETTPGPPTANSSTWPLPSSTGIRCFPNTARHPPSPEAVLVVAMGVESDRLSQSAYAGEGMARPFRRTTQGRERRWRCHARALATTAIKGRH